MLTINKSFILFFLSHHYFYVLGILQVVPWKRFLQDNDEEGGSTNESATADSATSGTLPAVMLLGISSVVILCSISLYACDMRDRCRHQRILCQGRELDNDENLEEGVVDIFTEHGVNDKERDMTDNDGTSAFRMSHCDESPKEPRRFSHFSETLPPVLSSSTNDVDPYQESISRVSTLTASLVEGSTSLGECLEERLCRHKSNHSNSSTWRHDVTELSESHRLPQEEKALVQLVLTPERKRDRCKITESKDEFDLADKEQPMQFIETSYGPAIEIPKVYDDDSGYEEDCEGSSIDNSSMSTCSSLTDWSVKSLGSAEHSKLLGEECLKDDVQTPQKQTARELSMLPLELSPDRPGDDDGSEGQDSTISCRFLFNDEDEISAVMSCASTVTTSKEWPDLEVNKIDQREMTQKIEPECKKLKCLDVEEREQPPQNTGMSMPLPPAHIESAPPEEYLYIEGRKQLLPGPTDHVIMPLSKMEGSIQAEEYIRDIFFVPIIEGDASSKERKITEILGLEVCNASCAATHPAVAKILDKSPLKGRIFEGDFILKVNDIETTGFSSNDITDTVLFDDRNTMLLGNDDGSIDEQKDEQSVYRMVKLTIMSSRMEEGSSSSGKSNGESTIGGDDLLLDKADSMAEF